MPKVPTKRKQLLDTKKPQRALDAGDKAYETFLQGLDLVSLGLKACSANLEREALMSAFRSDRKLVQKFDSSYKVSEVSAEYFDCEGTFTIEVVDPEADKKRSVVSVECVFSVHLHGRSPIAKEFAERFASSELRLILVPYARYFVSDITGQMSIPPVVIPLTITDH